MAPTDGEADTARHEVEPRAALRGLAPYAALLAGAALMAVGWYGISGKAVVAQQVPYLASASIPGMALMVSGAVLLASDRTRRSNERAADMVATLYRLLTEAVDTPATTAAPPASTAPGPIGSSRPTLVALPGAVRYHRADCALVRGKDDASLLEGDEATRRDLQPCPICEPPPPV